MASLAADISLFAQEPISRTTNRNSLITMTQETLPMASETQPSRNITDPTNVSPTPYQLQPQQEQLQQLQQLPGDCLPCKIVGCAGFGGLGLYSFYQAQQLPKTLVARRLGLGLMGTAFIGAAVYRLTMPIGQQQPPPSEK
ncbi:hypothetical protein EDD21DRAFT_387916 [Dissophora ornata]|nr:hypothetical protein EDD21DRAFT_387916 [Dissophora ornata]